jgi:hypothetical protein
MSAHDVFQSVCAGNGDGFVLPAGGTDVQNRRCIATGFAHDPVIDYSHLPLVAMFAQDTERDYGHEAYAKYDQQGLAIHFLKSAQTAL